MKIKVCTIFVFCTLGSSVISCFYPCAEPDFPYFKIKDIESYNMRSTNSGKNPWEIIEGHETIQWDRFFVRFGFQVDYIAQHQNPSAGGLLAKDCNERGYAGDKIGVDTIIVKTVDDYNENYLSGDTINNILLINPRTYSVEDFEKYTSLSNYIHENRDGIRSRSLELMLFEPPSSDVSFSFELIYKLNNGEQFVHTTESVFLIR